MTKGVIERSIPMKVGYGTAGFETKDGINRLPFLVPVWIVGPVGNEQLIPLVNIYWMGLN